MRPAWNTCNSERDSDRHREIVKRLRQECLKLDTANNPSEKRGGEKRGGEGGGQTDGRKKEMEGSRKNSNVPVHNTRRRWTVSDLHTLWLRLVHIFSRFLHTPPHCSELHLLAALCQVLIFSNY